MKKISIITVVYNGEDTIEDCINSVLSQTYQNIEHIIVDGKSSDKTMEIVEKYRDRLGKVISEKDQGIYDGMNKGIAAATGDFVGILNADDLYYDSKVLEQVVASFEASNVDCVFGNIVYVAENDTDKVIRRWRSSSYTEGSFQRGWHPPHPGFFVTKDVYDRFSSFDLDFEISADFELMLRFLERHKISSIFLDEMIVRMRLGGTSNNSWKNILKGNLNCLRAFKKNGISYPFLYPAYRLLPKLKQFFYKGV